jgi:hypothetical protein
MTFWGFLSDLTPFPGGCPLRFLGFGGLVSCYLLRGGAAMSLFNNKTETSSKKQSRSAPDYTT